MTGTSEPSTRPVAVRVRHSDGRVEVLTTQRTLLMRLTPLTAVQLANDLLEHARAANAPSTSPAAAEQVPGQLAIDDVAGGAR